MTESIPVDVRITKLGSSYKATAVEVGTDKVLATAMGTSQKRATEAVIARLNRRAELGMGR